MGAKPRTAVQLEPSNRVPAKGRSKLSKSRTSKNNAVSPRVRSKEAATGLGSQSKDNSRSKTRVSSSDKLASHMQRLEKRGERMELADFKAPMKQVLAKSLEKAGENEDDVKKNLEWIDLAIDNAPKVAEFLGIVAERIRASNAGRAQQVASNLPQAPPGWQGMGAMDKLRRKYNPDGSISAWYAAGIAFEQSLDVTGTAQGYYPPPSGQAQGFTPTRKQQWTPTVEQGAPVDPLETPTQRPPVDGFGPQHVSEEQIKKMHSNQEPQISKEQERDAKLVQMALSKINDTPIEVIDDYLNNYASKKADIEQYMLFVPDSLKEVLKRTPNEEFMQTIKTFCVNHKDSWNAERENKLLNIIDDMKKGL